MATATMVPIATQTLGSAAASITFSSIPGTYTDLRLVLSNAVTVAGGNDIQFRFNGDTATNYSITGLHGSGTTATSVSTTSATVIDPDASSAVGTSATVPNLYTIDVFSYAGSTNKTCLVINSEDHNGTGDVGLSVALWRSTAAITSITILCGSNLLTGTIATLWGI